MEKGENIKKDKLKGKFIILTIILLVLSAVLVYFLKDNFFVKSDYVYLKDRQNYIIENVKEDFLKSYYGNTKTLVVFSASWCKYCVEEQNELNNFMKNNPDTKVIIVSHDKTYEDLENYLKTNNFNWSVIFDKDKTIRENLDPGSKGIPATYLLDKNGKIIGYSKGAKAENEFLQFYNNEIDIY